MSTWTGKGASQEDLMTKDECILVDHNDKVISTGNKMVSHDFSPKTPRGLLHRAFSVFLFNSEGKLLLQQRAKDKITFPNVWTNTCCSHPLSGLSPSEVDSDSEIATGTVSGAKAAAIRKLDHELGIPVGAIKADEFKFLTRLHYWAADVVTHGAKSPWGEHEIDYILFVQKDVQVAANPEEVSDTKYVSLAELQQMMDPASGLIWSPWFRIIVEKFLVHWWKNLSETLTTDKFVNTKDIFRFDPTSEHMGGAGDAREWLGKSKSPYDVVTSSPQGDTSKKQGGYGKVKTHSHSKLSQIIRFDEVIAALYVVYGKPFSVNIDGRTDPDVAFCDEILGKVSRSFAMVIRLLPKGLAIEIMLFYLALRALDTIEDDMDAFKDNNQKKIDHLKDFYKVGLVTDGWSMDGVGEGDEKRLLQEYFKVVRVFKTLSAASQEVIQDITQRMGAGMAFYVEKDLGQGTVSIADYDLYCHYVAGLVGEGLSRLFSCTEFEAPQVAAVSKTLANTMGLFLQKNNIIRDYLEDYEDGRTFWPKEIWGAYTSHGNLGELKEPENLDRSLACLNHMIYNALLCVPECIEYMALLRCREVFQFCAIPQAMAMATLADLFNNPKVFTGVVKIRKGSACKLMLDVDSVGGLHKWFYLYSKQIRDAVPDKDPNAKELRSICQKIMDLTSKDAKPAITHSYIASLKTIAPVGLVWSGWNLFGLSNIVSGSFKFGIKSLKSLQDYATASVFGLSAFLLLGYRFIKPKNNLIEGKQVTSK